MSLTHDEQRTLLNPERKRITPTLWLSASEASAAASLWQPGLLHCPSQPPTPVLSDGLRRLHDRGLITVSRATKPESLHTTQWTGQRAEAAAARLCILRYSHGAYVQSLMTGRTGLTRQGGFNLTTLAVILSWHYRYTTVRGAQVTCEGDRLTLTELQHHGPAHQHHFQSAPHGGPSDPETITIAGTDDYSDQGERLDGPTLSYLVRALGSTLRPDAPAGLVGRRTLDIDFDTLEVHPAGQHPSTYTQTLPGLTQDALGYHRAPDLADAAAFTDWAERHLIITVSCGRSKHRLRLDPHTHTTHAHPGGLNAASREGEHLLAALDPTLTVGCHDAATALAMFGDPSRYQRDWNRQSSALAAARTIARTVQYLDAGLPLPQTVSFLRLGLTAAQTETMLRLQDADPDLTGQRLRDWAKFHWKSGPLTVDEIPI